MEHDHHMHTAQPEHGQHACCAPRHRRDWMFLTVSAVVIASVVLTYAGGSAVHEMPLLGDFVHSVTDFLLTVWWGILLGIVAVAALGKMPREWVAAVLGRPGTAASIVRAVIAGLLLDLCSHGILLVGMKLYERGASIGQTYAFLISSPWNSLTMTFILWSLIGFPWTLAFIALSMLIAFVAGIAADALQRRGALPPNPNTPDFPENLHLGKEVLTSLYSVRPSLTGIVRSLIDATKESVMVLRWMFLGIIIAAAIRTFFPPDTFQTVFGPTLLGLASTLFFATILEVCSEGSSPVAADFLLRAHAPGNSFAFLMAGVATDYTEVLSLKSTTRSWKLALSLSLLTLPQTVLIAWALNHLA